MPLIAPHIPRAGTAAAMSATMEEPRAALSGALSTPSNIVSTLQEPVAALSGAETGITAVLKDPTAALSSTQTQTGTMAAAVNSPVATATGTHATSPTIAAVLKDPTAALSSTQTQTGTMAAGMKGPVTAQLGTQQGAGTISVTAPKLSSSITTGSFVARDPATGNLTLDGQRFRFSGANAANDIGLVSSSNGNAYGGTVHSSNYLTTHSQIDALLNSAEAMNATVLRAFSAASSTNHVDAVQPTLGVFNSAALEPIDYALQQCALRGIKLIVPLCDEYSSKPWYVTQTGGGANSNFHTRTATIDAFKAHISYVLDHVNVYTGIALKNDPAVLCWETGNELTSSGASSAQFATWTDTISQYIKLTKGAQQLVMDGGYGITGDSIVFDTARLTLTYVDIYSDHSYDTTRTPKWLISEADAAHSFGKAYVVGEYSWTDKTTGGSLLNWNLTQLLSQANSSEHIDGDLFWDLLAPLTTWGDGFTMHRPGDTSDMTARGTQLTDHATIMSSGNFPVITVMDWASTSVSSNSLSLTFSSSNWVPRMNDVIIYWATVTIAGGGIVVPGGWTNVLGGNTVVDNGALTEYCVYHIVTSAEQTAGTLTYTASAIQGTLQTTIVGMVLRGVDADNVVDSAASTSNASSVTPHVLAGLTGSNLSTNSLVLSGVAKDGTGDETTPDGWGLAGFGATNQSLYVFARNTLTTAGSNVAATNVTPSAADEYASITVAFPIRPVVPTLYPPVKRPNYGSLIQI